MSRTLRETLAFRSARKPLSLEEFLTIWNSLDDTTKESVVLSYEPEKHPERGGFKVYKI